VLSGRTPLVVPILAGAAFGAASIAQPLGDSDIFWHLATAREALAHGLVTTDVFSWTVSGHPISTDQWLGQLLWYGAYVAAGWKGILVLRTLAVALLVGVIVWTTLRERPRAPLFALIAGLPAILLVRMVSVERPELFGFLCFVALVPLLRSARRGSGRALVALPLLVLVWAQLHGSFALGAVLVIVVTFEGFVRDQARRVGYLGCAGATLLATFLTPAGPAVWSAPGLHLLHPPRFIQEWALPDVTTVNGLIFAAAIAATIAVAFLAPTRDPAAAAVLVPVLFIALVAIRQAPFFAIAAAPFVTRHGPDALAGLFRPGQQGRVLTNAGRSPVRIDLLAGILGAAMLVAAVAAGPSAPDLSRYPVSAVPLLDPGPGVLNEYDWGGFLIWSAPRTPVFVDGRLTPYLPEVVDDYTAIVGARSGWRELISRRGIRTLLVRPDTPVAIRARDLGWPVRVLNDTAVLITVP